VNYVEFMNRRIKDAVAGHDRLVVYGQNVSTGSCLSGLSRGFDKLPNCTVINTSNAESTLVGMGFGLMLRGISSIFFMKQLDFLLLGVEQLTDTWNAFRHREINASFTIAAIVVDSGWEGPQSCLNNLADISSVSRVPGYSISNQADADAVIGRQLSKPGVRIVTFSQRLFRTPIMTWEGARSFGRDDGVIQYAAGDHATIVAHNLSMPQAKCVRDEMTKRGQSASLFSIGATIPDIIDPVLADAERTGCAIVLDDSKSVNLPSHQFVTALRERAPHVKVVEVTRAWSLEAAAPNADQMDIKVAELIDKFGLAA
jgi:pyruvate/2-oxoglutarate/acetoin dehydrogenase E1 component